MIVLPIIRNLGGQKNQAESTHQNWPKRPRAETTQVETTQAETTQGRNDPGRNSPGPKRQGRNDWAETTRNGHSRFWPV